MTSDYDNDLDLFLRFVRLDFYLFQFLSGVHDREIAVGRVDDEVFIADGFLCRVLRFWSSFNNFKVSPPLSLGYLSFTTFI